MSNVSIAKPKLAKRRRIRKAELLEICERQLEQLRLEGDPEYAATVATFRQRLSDEIREADQEKKQARKSARLQAKLEKKGLSDTTDDAWEEDDSDVEIIYAE